MRSARSRMPHATLLAGALALTAFAARSQTLQKTALPIDGNGNGIFEMGESIQYTLTFTNTGLADLADVVVRDDSSACIGLDIASVVIEPAASGTDSSSGNAVQVDLVSPLMPGEAVTITFTASASDVGNCCNQAAWTATGLPGGLSDRDPSDATPDQPTCHFATQPGGLEYEAVIDMQVLTAGCIAPGSTVGFRVHIQNIGSRPLRNGFFEDTLPSGFTNVVVDAGLSYDPATNRVFTTPSTYGVGQTTESTYQADIPCTASGTLTNTATFSFEDDTGAVQTRTDTETVSWAQPDLSDSTKIWADDPADGDSLVSPGENLTFTITVRNSGACEALNVLALDDLDPRFVSSAPTLVISDGGFYDPVTGRIEWNQVTTPQLAAIPTDGAVTLTVTTQVEALTPGGSYLPNSVTLTPLGNDSACPGLPSVTRTIAMQNGDVVYGDVPPVTVLLRNDYISCRASAFGVMGRGGSDGIPVLRRRPDPQQCSAPSAIMTAHPQTDVIIDPVSPYQLADALRIADRCPQIASGSGRVMIFYELQDDCTETLRVTKDPLNASNLIVSW